MTRVPRPTTSQTRDTCLRYAEQLEALEPHGGDGTGIPRAAIRMPMYIANDSSDLNLMEWISPSHELHRKLTKGRSPVTQQQQHAPIYVPSPNKSLDSTPRTPASMHFTKFNKQGASKNVQLSSSRHLNARLFGANAARPQTAAAPLNNLVDHRRGALIRKFPKKIHNQMHLANKGPMSFTEKLQPLPEQMPRDPDDFEDNTVYSSEISPGRDRVIASGLPAHRTNSERRVQLHKLQPEEDQKASDLRLISKLWHQECKCSGTIQQRLSYLLKSKYKEAFEDGRIYTVEKCKYNDFKAEVARILKKLQRAGAPQLPTLNVKYELAVACVDEVFGKGMGEEYMKLEMYFMQPNAGYALQFINTRKDADHVKEIAERVQNEYKDVQNITGFMLDQLRLSELLSDSDALRCCSFFVRLNQEFASQSSQASASEIV